MESWMPFFVIVIALTVVIQSVVLIVLFLNVRRTASRIDEIVTDLNARMSPILTNLQLLVEDLSPRISSVVADAAEITHLARNQSQKIDRVVTELLEHLRSQIIHVDHLITSAMDAAEEVGSRVKQTVWGPVVRGCRGCSWHPDGLRLLAKYAACSPTGGRTQRTPGQRNGCLIPPPGIMANPAAT